MALLFLWIPLVLIRHHPRRWWLYFALGAIPFIVLMMLIQPIWIAPLFDDFGPMEDKRLEARILALADRAGIEGSRVFQVNKSEDTNAVNAYVTGFGGSKRIVLWDTMVDRLEEEEVLFVMGHEMGHYVLHHIYWMILVVVGIILAGGFLVQVSARSLLARFGPRFGVQKLHEIGALPLILLLFGLASFLLSPLVSAYSRHNERVADIFGLEITRDNTAAAGAFVRLQTSNLSDPYPPAWVTFLRGSHPPLGHRITFINNYRPWEEGEPLRYGHLFEAPPEGGEAAGEAAGSGTP
jgi:Zn-dependent protease with chaperone function